MPILLRASFTSLLLLVITVSLFGQQLSLVPYPRKLTVGQGTFELNTKTTLIAADECYDEAQYFASWLSMATGIKFKLQSLTSDVPKQNFILLISGEAIPFDEALEQVKNSPLPGVRIDHIQDQSEQYSIMINQNGIIVKASQPVGVFHATQTLIQLMPPAPPGQYIGLPFEFQSMTIDDSPRFRHRGMLLDCSRHFMPVPVVKKYIDLLAFYKMNVLHWHLTDDQGWRLQIDKYPLLTEVGAWRTEADGSRYGGFYTKDQVSEIVKYASSRHITIIPEIEMPGHCSAALAAYPQLSCTGQPVSVPATWGVFKDVYCAGNDETLQFLKDVLSEVCDLFPSKYIHLGGDEVPDFHWKQCAKCQKVKKTNKLKNETELQSWLLNEMALYLATRGKRMIGWDEITDGNLPAQAVVQSWRGEEGAVKAAQKQHFAIMSPTSHCYFDYGLESIDFKRVYAFDPIPAALESTGKGYIMGGECNLWSEHITPETLDSKVFPRLMAFSEVMWTFPEERPADALLQRLEAHFDRFDKLGVDYGFPAVPAKVKMEHITDEALLISLESLLQGAQIEWAFITGENTTPDWKPYREPAGIHESAEVHVRSTWRGKKYPEELVRSFEWHKGLNKTIKLNYTPSIYYTGGGTNALADGALGSNAFRDGLWQGVQGIGKEGMEAIIDLGEIMPVHYIGTRWYHYADAWIFRPEIVQYYISDDGNNWKEVYLSGPMPRADTSGEIIVPVQAIGLDVKARYVRMAATSIGPCPVWHNATGEPSWLFCDELVVR